MDKRNLIDSPLGTVWLKPREHRTRPHDTKLKSYDVMVGETNLGTVEGHYPTIEKEIPGKRYVAWRRESRTVHWLAFYHGVRNMYRNPYVTRKSAIEAVVAGYMREQERLGETA